MDTSELLKRVRRVEIKSRGLSDRIFSGQYHSAFKGLGMTFSENREYQPGDDMRSLKSEFDYSHKKKFTDVLGNITR